MVITADTGIFNDNKIHNLLIFLHQAIRGTVRQKQVDSIVCVSLAKTAKIRRYTEDPPETHKKVLSAATEDPAFEACGALGG